MAAQRVCVSCWPGIRSLPGVVLSHGLCRMHELELLEDARLIRFWESAELSIRRNFLALLFIAAGLALVAVAAHFFRAQLPRSFGARSFWDAVAPLERVTGPRSNAGFLRTGSTGKALAGGVPPFSNNN